MHIKGNVLDSAGMSRFVLLSVALHLIVLAALDHGMKLPQLRASTLSVTLQKPTSMIEKSVRHSGFHQTTKASGPIASGANHHQTPHQRLTEAAPQVIPQSSSTPNMKQTNIHRETSDPFSELHSNPPLPITKRRSETPVAIESTQDNVAQQTDVKPTRQQDKTMLASRLEGKLRDALAPYFAYPLIARRNGWEGRVRIGLRVEADGHLSHMRIARSSGYRLLDDSALATLSHIGAVPEAADWLEGRHFDMVLPIDYRLIDGQI